MLEKDHVGEFISVDEPNDVCGARHEVTAGEQVEEIKAVVEIEGFKQIIGNNCFGEIYFALNVMKILIGGSNKFNSIEEDFVVPPEFVNVITLSSWDDAFDGVGVALAVNGFLVGLDGED